MFGMVLVLMYCNIRVMRVYHGVSMTKVATCASFQVLKAVEYMHQKGICHRNLSTDAALLHSKEPMLNDSAVDFYFHSSKLD